MAVDSNGNPHIAYRFDLDSCPVLYSSWTGTDWDTQTADPNTYSHGDPVALALDSEGTPHIGWIDLRPFGWGQYTSGTIWYATSNQPVPIVTPAPSPSVPEFPTWIILPLAVAATLTTCAFAKKKRQTSTKA